MRVMNGGASCPSVVHDERHILVRAAQESTILAWKWRKQIFQEKLKRTLRHGPKQATNSEDEQTGTEQGQGKHKVDVKLGTSSKNYNPSSTVNNVG